MQKFFLIIRKAFPFVVVAVALIVTGCGEDQGSDASQGASEPAVEGSANGSVEGEDGSVEGGDGAAAETVKTGSLNKEQFIERADEICLETRERFEAEFEALANEETPKLAGKNKKEESEEEEARKRLIDTVLVPTYEEQIKQIRALGAPAGDEDAIAAFLQATQDNLDEASAEPIPYIKRIGQKFTEARELASAYGMTGCASAMDLSKGLAVRG